MKTLINLSASYLLLFVATCSFGQTTWDQLLKKAEKQYAKGKYTKVEKITSKLRKKDIAKKYNADTSLFALTYIMEAKAFEALAQYDLMDESLTNAINYLENTKIKSPANYVMGLLRITDIYQAYGNYQKASNFLKLAEDVAPELIDSELLLAEIKIRRTLNDVDLGEFSNGLEQIATLQKSFPNLVEQSYSTEEASSEDISYRKRLLAKLYTAEIKAYLEKGEYQKALELIDKNEKTVAKLVDTKTRAFIEFKNAEVQSLIGFGEIKKAQRYANRLIKLKAPGRLMELAGNTAFDAAIAAYEFTSADVVITNIEKSLSKAKVEKDYYKLISATQTAIVASHVKEEKTEPLADLEESLEEGSSLLPADHLHFTRVNHRAIDYIFEENDAEMIVEAQDYYTNLANSYNLRFGQASLFTNIFKVNLAGYYLKYSEEPKLAFQLLAGDKYKKPLEELSVQHPKYAQMVTSLMEYFSLVGNFDYPIKLTKTVLEGMQGNPNISNTEIGTKMVELARLQIDGGYYKDAEINTDEALKLIRRDGEKKSEEYVTALNNAAYLYGTIGLYTKAKRQLNKAESIYKKLETRNDELRMQSNIDLATLSTRMGNYSETEELLNEVIEERSELLGASSRRLIKPYRNLGEVFLIRGDYPSSEKNLREALTITNDVIGDSTLLYAETLSLISKLYLALGNYENALVNATEVLKIREKVLRENHILFADTYTNLGQIHAKMESELEVVERYFTLAKEITESNFDNTHPLYAEALKNLAFVSIRKEEYDQALMLLNQADEIWRDALANQNKSSGEVARLKGDIYSYQGEFKSAKSEYEKAARYFKRIFSNEHPDYLNTQSKLARAYYINGEISKVESILSETTEAYLSYTKKYFPTLSEEEKAKFWNKIKPDFEFYNTVAVQFKDTKPKYLEDMYDFALATKGLLLSSSIKTRNTILNSGDEELIKLFKEWIEKKEFLTGTLSQSDEDLAENGIDRKQLTTEIELLEKILSEKSDAFEESFEFKVYSWSDVRKSLEDDEAAVEIIRYREFDETFNEDKIRYAALILTAETRANPDLVLLDNGNDMEGKFFKYHRNMTKYKLSDGKSYEVYWKAIQEKIGEKKVVFLSPDGVYNQINVESFKVNGTDFVIDNTNVRVVGNTKNIAAQRSRGARKAAKNQGAKEYSAMLLGNPKYYESEQALVKAKADQSRGKAVSIVTQLPGTEEEVKTITDLLTENGWEIDSYLGKTATEDQIKAAQSYTLIHIATHGFFDDKKKDKKTASLLSEDDDNPLERAGLITEGGGDVILKATSNYNIGDGILTANEAMNLNFENTELIVLSACETGRGEVQQGEGVFGLQRSFLVAGADAIVMSLFKVSDKVTQMLMVEFYKNWLAGQDKRTAFNNAQLKIKESYPNPIYWGAFTMIAKS